MSSDLHTLSGAYAVDALSPEEAQEFLQHLDGCPACRQEVRELREAAALMGAGEAAVPPAELKQQVLAAASRQPQLPPKVGHPARATKSRRVLVMVAAAAAVVALAVGAGIGISRLNSSPQDALAAPVARVFHAPDAHTATMDTANGGVVSVATSPRLGEMAVDTDRLPPLKQGQVYQIWAIANGTAHSAALLPDPDTGAAMAMPARGVRVAITIEPAGGSDQPTTKPIMSVVPSSV